MIPDGSVVGCASFMEALHEDGPLTWQLRGMATRRDLQRRGIGSDLLTAAVPALHTEFGERPVWCNARCSAVGFYQRHGWQVVSAVFDVPDVGPHVRMRIGD